MKRSTTIPFAMFLQVVVLALAFGGYRIAAYNGWIIATHGWRPIVGGVPPIPKNASEEFSVFVVGDTGKATPDRERVVNAMRGQMNLAETDCILLPGDNFYEHGVTSTEDPRFQTDFEKLFDSTVFNCPFYVCLGNHDYGGNVDAQVHYTQWSERWKLPQKYYHVSEPAGATTVDLFVIDTVPIHEQHKSARKQLGWLERKLAESTARWKVVMGHHPVITGGRHGISRTITNALRPLFDTYDIDLYISGHDHDLQLNDSGDGWLQVVSGSGSKLRSTSWIDETIYCESTPGFCWLLFREGQLSITLYSTDRPIYTHTLAGRSPPSKSMQ